MSRTGIIAIITLTAALMCAASVGAADSDPNALPDSNLPEFPSWPPEPNSAIPREAAKPKFEIKEELRSAMNAASLTRLARHRYMAEGADMYQEREALVMVNAAVLLDPFANYAMQDFLYLKTHLNEREDWPVMRRLLMNYLDKKPETEVARAMVRYLLEDLNSREQRENALADIANLVAGRNNELASDVVTEQALLAMERGDVRTGAMRLMTAYNLNPYNGLACRKLDDAGRGQLTPAFYVSQERLAMATNPLDLEAALKFSAFAERFGGYAAAANGYSYAASLFKYLYPNVRLTAEICRPWARSCYRTPGKGGKCIEIAEMVRASGDFDAVVEGIALKAAEKQGPASLAKEIKSGVEARLGQMSDQESAGAAGAAERASWYYSFGAKDAGKALSWANKAYAMEPNSPSAKSLLIYALVINGQTDVAKEMMKERQGGADASTATPPDQITAPATGVMLLGEQKKADAIAALKTAVDMRPDSIEAAQAQDLLGFNGETYSGIDQTASDEIVAVLTKSYGEDMAPKWTSPDKIISMKLQARMEDTPSSDSDVKVELSITNNSSGPIMIGEGGLFSGQVRIDGVLKGDVNKDLPQLMLKRVGQWTALDAGETKLVPLDMNVGGVFEALQNCPQATFDIILTAYMDAVEVDGAVHNRVKGLEPARVVIRKAGIKPTREFIANKLDSLSKGYQTQKVDAVKLFASLLRERMSIDQGKVKYKAAKLELLLLESGIVRGLSDEDWMVRMQTLAATSDMKLGFEITNSVAACLQNKFWPVRLMSLYVLGTTQGDEFAKVLKWYIDNDKDENVRKMADILLNQRQGTVPKAAVSSPEKP